MSFQSRIVFDPQNSDVPLEVRNQISDELASDNCLSNDSYFSWTSEYHGEDYPIIDKYLLDNNITSCLINCSW